MSTFTNQIVSGLDSTSMKIAQSKHEQKLVKHPSTDFTRDRKITFEELTKFIICIATKPMKDELTDCFGLTLNVATSSALVQARDKLLPEVFKELLYRMNDSLFSYETVKRFRLIAVDGSDLPIFHIESDEDTYQCLGDTQKARSHYHINVAYDSLHTTYVDMVIQRGGKKTNIVLYERWLSAWKMIGIKLCLFVIAIPPLRILRKRLLNQDNSF